MPKPVRTKAQVRKDRAQLKKLKSTGLFKGKIDARKPPSAAQKRALKRYADVISGKAAVVKPKNPKSYKGTFKVVGDKVIVPKRGGRVRVDKEGVIRTTRKIAGKVRQARYSRLDRIMNGEGKPGAIYVLPLMHGSDIHYYKFNNAEELRQFVFETSPKVGQTFKNWASYVLEVDEAKMDRAIERGDVGDEEEYFDEQALRYLRSLARRKAARAARRG